MPVDFVTVVTADNVRNLGLQARSIAKFIEPRSVGSINIIVNSFTPDHLYQILLTEVVEHYGPLKEQVEIYPISRFARPHLNCSQDVIGEAAAMLMSRILESPYFVLMRPGDHFIQPARANDFGDQGGGRSRAARVEARPHQLRKAAASFEVLNVPLPEIGAEFVADQLPFVFGVAEVRRLVDLLEGQYSAPLDDIFAKVAGAIDPVYLYIAFTMRASTEIRDVFKVGPRMISGLKLDDGNHTIDAWIEDAQKRILANVDALAEAAADKAVEAKLTQFWVDCGLFENDVAAAAALPGAGRSHVAAMVDA